MLDFEKFLKYKFSTDTRTIKPGEIFIAIKGENFDGHNFTEKAFQLGASYAVVDESDVFNDLFNTYHEKLLKVESTKDFLLQMAHFKREKSHAKFIGVTGSTGKTTTKELLAFLLRNSGLKVSASLGNFNNSIGMPLSILNSNLDDDFVVIEIGISHKNEMQELSRVLSPDYAVITNIELSHIGNFNSILEIADEKSDLLRSIKQEGKFYSFKNSPFLELFKTKLQKNSIRSFYCDLDTINILPSENGLNISGVFLNDIRVSYHINSIDVSEAVDSVLAVFAVSDILNLNQDEVNNLALSLKNFNMISGRGNASDLTINNKHIKLIDQSYNASISSMRNGIKSLNYYRNKDHRIIAVMGEILELGERSMSEHWKLVPIVDKYSVDKVYLCGSAILENIFGEMEDSKKGGYAKSSQELFSLIKDDLQDGDIIFVKGSHSMNMSYIIQELKKLENLC